MKLDMDQASRQSDLPDKVTTRRIGWWVVGFADRLALPEKILDFCGSLPIYNVEAVPLDSMNVTLQRVSGQGRRKRSHWSSYYNPCSFTADIAKINSCLKKVGPYKIKLNCKYATLSCSYRAICKHQPVVSRGSFAHASLLGYTCKGYSYYRSYTGICCSPVC